ncbi:hypothetical protein GF407_11070 [candidate division KSB1 bacterium]|nr:hypothetical protein [candidate division KSB1 bacterium]
MIKILKTISMLSLLLLILAPLAYLQGRLQLDTTKTWLIVATLVWFISAPFWMNHGRQS